MTSRSSLASRSTAWLAAHGARPAAGRDGGTGEVSGDLSVPGAAGAGLQRGADHGGGVRAAGRTVPGSSTRVARQPEQRALRGRSCRVVVRSRTRRSRAWPQGRSAAPQPAPPMAPAARSVSTRSGTATITARRAEHGAHGARAWSTSSGNGRGQLVLLGESSKIGATARQCRADRRVERDTMTMRPRGIGEAGRGARHGGVADDASTNGRHVVTLSGAAPTPWSSPSMAANTGLLATASGSRCPTDEA